MKYLPILLLAGCVSNPPAEIQYRTQIVDTSCTRFSIIRIPEADLPNLSPRLKEQVLAHDRAWTEACSPSKP